MWDVQGDLKAVASSLSPLPLEELGLFSNRLSGKLEEMCPLVQQARPLPMDCFAVVAACLQCLHNSLPLGRASGPALASLASPPASNPHACSCCGCALHA